MGHWIFPRSADEVGQMPYFLFHCPLGIALTISKKELSSVIDWPLRNRLPICITRKSKSGVLSGRDPVFVCVCPKPLEVKKLERSRFFCTGLCLAAHPVRPIL